MGNYDVHEPSAPMLRSLKKLLLALMLQYNIDPFEKQAYFTPIQEDPRLIASTHTSLVEYLPTLRTEMNAFLQTLR
jgi:hypothetical protein